MLLFAYVMDGSVPFHLVQQAAEIQQSGFGLFFHRFRFDEVRASHDIFQSRESHFRQVFTDLLGQEAEIVYYVLVMSAEVAAQYRVLGSHPDGTSVGVALAHHDASQYDKDSSAESEFFSPEEGHADDVAPRLELSVSL